MKAIHDPGRCRERIYLEFWEGHKKEPSDLWTRGLFFEQELIGSTRDGDKIVLPKIGIKNLKPPKSATKKIKIDYLVKKDYIREQVDKESPEELDKLIAALPEDLSAGNPSTAERELRELVDWSKEKIQELGIEILEVQPEKTVGDLVAHFDAIGIIEGRKAIIDIKYTETTIEDRWNGWADIEEKDHTQAKFYRYISSFLTEDNSYLPFYYIIVGKSKWIRIVEVKLDLVNGSFEYFERDLNRTRNEVHNFERRSSGDFNTCEACPFKEICNKRVKLPVIESITI